MTPDLTPINDILSHLSLTQIIEVIVLLIAGLIMIKLLMKAVVRLLDRTKLDKTIVRLSATAIKVILWTLLIFIVAGTMGINMNSVIALFSVLALAVTLAIQGILSNIAGGAQVISAHPFKVGDYVQIGDMSGTVQEMGMTYTILVTPDNYRVHIPNSKTVTSEITNYTVLGTRRLDIPIGLSYDNSPAEVRQALMHLIGQTEGILPDPAPQVLVTDYGDSSIVYTMRMWTKTADYWPVRHALNEGIWDAVNKAGISIPFPQMDVHVDRQGEPADGGNG